VCPFHFRIRSHHPEKKSLYHLLRKGFPDKAVGKRFGFAPRYAAGGTDRETRRNLLVIQSLDTEIALDRSLLVIIILHGSERAGLQTLFTTDADVFIDEHKPVFISGNGIYRARLLAGGIRAMVAVNRVKIGRFFNDSHQARTNTQLMLLFTSHLAGMAAHAVFPVKH
jgi:hypothetical protein